MPLGFLGGTGIEGKALALRFGASGVPVVVGSRSADRARAVADECNRLLGRSAIEGCSNTDMLARAEIVFLTVPFETAVAAIESCRQDLRPSHIVVDVTVPIKFEGGKPEFVEQPAGSNAELISGHLPSGIPFVAAFKTIPAHALADLNQQLSCDVFVCGDSKEARATVMTTAAQIPTVRPLDAGPLIAARTLERMTFLAITLNRRYKSKGARFRVQGL